MPPPPGERGGGSLFGPAARWRLDFYGLTRARLGVGRSYWVIHSRCFTPSPRGWTPRDWTPPGTKTGPEGGSKDNITCMVVLFKDGTGNCHPEREFLPGALADAV